MAQTGKKWYVLRAVSGKEAKVKEYLEALMKHDTFLADNVGEIFYLNRYPGYTTPINDLNTKSMTQTINAIMSDAESTTTALCVSSLRVGQVVLCASSS